MATIGEWQRKRDWAEIETTNLQISDKDLTSEKLGAYISDCIQALEETGEFPKVSDHANCLDTLFNTMDGPARELLPDYVIIKRKTGFNRTIDSRIDAFGSVALDTKSAAYYLYAKNTNIDTTVPRCTEAISGDDLKPVSCISKMLDSWKNYRSDGGYHEIENFPGFESMLFSLAPTLHRHRCVITTPAHRRSSKDISSSYGKVVNCLEKVFIEDNANREELMNISADPDVDFSIPCSPRRPTEPSRPCVQMIFESPELVEFHDSFASLPNVQMLLKKQIFVPQVIDALTPAPLVTGYQWEIDGGGATDIFSSELFDPYGSECRFLKEINPKDGSIRERPPTSCIDYALTVYNDPTYRKRIPEYDETARHVLLKMSINKRMSEYISDRICLAPDGRTRVQCIDKILSVTPETTLETVATGYYNMADAVFGDDELPGVNIVEAQCFVPVPRGNYDMRGRDRTKYKAVSCFEKVIDYSPAYVDKVINLIENGKVSINLFDPVCSTGDDRISCFDKLVNSSVASTISHDLLRGLRVSVPRWKGDKGAIGFAMVEASKENERLPQLNYPVETLDRIIESPLIKDTNLVDRECHQLAGYDSVGGVTPREWVNSMGRKRKITRASGIQAVNEAYADLRIDTSKRTSCINRILGIYEKYPEMAVSKNKSRDAPSVIQKLTETKTNFAARACSIGTAAVPCMQKAIRAAGAIGLYNLREAAMKTRHGTRKRGYERYMPSTAGERELVYKSLSPIVSNLDVLDKSCNDAAGNAQVCLATIIESVGGSPPPSLLAALLSRRDFHKMPPVEIVIGGAPTDLKSYICEHGSMASIAEWLALAPDQRAMARGRQSYNGRALELYAGCRGCEPNNTPESRQCYDNMCWESTQECSSSGRCGYRQWLEASIKEGKMYQNYGDPLGIAGVYEVQAPTGTAEAKIRDYKHKYSWVVRNLVKYEGTPSEFKGKRAVLHIITDTTDAPRDVINEDYLIEFKYIDVDNLQADPLHTTTINASEILSRKSPVAGEINKDPKIAKEFQRFVTSKPTSTKSKLTVVISRRLADLTRASSCQHWTSCMNQSGQSGEQGTGQAPNVYEGLGGYIAYIAPKELSPTWLARRFIYIVNARDGSKCVSLQPTYGAAEYQNILEDATREILVLNGVNTSLTCPSRGSSDNWAWNVTAHREDPYSGSLFDIGVKNVRARCVEDELRRWEEDFIARTMPFAEEMGYRPSQEELTDRIRGTEEYTTAKRDAQRSCRDEVRINQHTSTRPLWNPGDLAYATPRDLRLLSARDYVDNDSVPHLGDPNAVVAANLAKWGENFVRAVRPVAEW